MSKKSFKTSEALENVEFDVDGEDFIAVPPNRLPANVLIRYSEKVQEGKLYEAHRDFFNRALVEESAARFEAKLSSGDTPVTLPMMIEIAEYLISAYSDFAPKK